MATSTLTDADILRIAREAVPEHIRPLGRVVAPPPGKLALAAIGPMEGGTAKKDTLIADLAKRVGAKLPKKADADVSMVEFPEQTALGLRTTVVHVKNGKVARVFKRG